MKQHVVLLKSRATNLGGLEKSASRIATAFVEKGARVSVLTTGPQPKNSSEVSFYAIQTIPWPSFIRMEQFDKFTRSWLKNNPADLVFGMDRNREQTHIRAGNGVHDAYLQSRIFTEGKLKAFSCRLNPMHRKILELEKNAFENPRLKKLFTNSNMVREQILERYNTDPAKIQVIHNGVEWNDMEQDFERWPSIREKAFERFQLDPHLFHILFIGNGYRRKGLNQLLLGLSRLANPRVHLSVIGHDNQIEKYIAKAKRLQISKQVRFFGPQPEMRPFYQLADVLAIPSFYDPFANVTIEALAMGLFVISSSFNGGSEILTSQNGAVIENLLDPDAIVETLKIALQHQKTEINSKAIRQSVKHLDFSKQMSLLTEACLE
jgi:UDP-glucose:(heptosyl)LPS alpha-1,3-glucosyltransferase